MNDEIREILKELNKIIDNTSYNEEFTYFQTSHICKLLDYITNLQEGNERLNENNQAMQEEMAKTWKIADDYKSRIDKATEYIKDSGITFLNLANQRCFCNNNCADKIINILNGGDE